MNPIEFQGKWVGVEVKERSASKEFFNISRVIDHPTTAEMDPTGDTLTFERRATKVMSGTGWVVV